MKLPTNAQINETVANAAEPIANPLPIAAVVLPTASSLSVMLRTSSGKWQLSARPPALSAIGPNASIETVDGEHELMVLDIDKAIWHKEDDIRFRDCCTLDGKLYFICDEDYKTFEADKIYVINPDEPSEALYDRVWEAELGPFDEYVEDKKIYSKMSLRLIAEAGAKVNVYIKMDNGSWETVKKFEFAGTGGETVPIVPRRCDRFSIKIKGKGNCEIKSLTRRFRRGSGVKA